MWHPWRQLRELSHIDLFWDDMEDRLGHTNFAAGCITLTTGMTQAERRSTLTHELIHLERGQCSPEHDRREEAAVNRLAAKRLIPIERLAEALAWSGDPSEVADELWVDVPTLEARLTCLHPAERAFLNRRLSDPEDSDFAGFVNGAFDLASLAEEHAGSVSCGPLNVGGQVAVDVDCHCDGVMA